MTARKAVTHAIYQLTDAKISGAQLDAELIMAYVLGRDRAWLKAHDDTELDKPQLQQFDALVNRRLQREPLVHLTGKREFYGLEFEITPDVLTPRAETEQLVDWTIKYAPKNSALIDLGTGCGNIAIAIKKHRPDLAVTATDLSEHELAVARRNATKHRVNITFIASDLWQSVPGRFATVACNLPYLADSADLMPEVKREPAVALFGGPDGLGLYRRFFAGLPAHLEPSGFVFIESDPWQHEPLIAAAKSALSPIEQGYFILGFQLTKN